MTSRLITAILLTLAAVDTASARMVSEKERMHQQAEHLCYNDVQTLCNAAVPDEAKVTACMKTHRTELSPSCRKVFEAGMK